MCSSTFQPWPGAATAAAYPWGAASRRTRDAGRPLSARTHTRGLARCFEPDELFERADAAIRRARRDRTDPVPARCRCRCRARPRSPTRASRRCATSSRSSSRPMTYGASTLTSGTTAGRHPQPASDFECARRRVRTPHRSRSTAGPIRRDDSRHHPARAQRGTKGCFGRAAHQREQPRIDRCGSRRGHGRNRERTMRYSHAPDAICS